MLSCYSVCTVHQNQSFVHKADRINPKSFLVFSSVMAKHNVVSIKLELGGKYILKIFKENHVEQNTHFH